MDQVVKFQQAHEVLLEITGGHRSSPIQIYDDTWFYFSGSEIYVIEKSTCSDLEEAKERFREMKCIEYFCEKEYKENSGLCAFDLRLPDNHCWGDTVHSIFDAKNQVYLEDQEDE